MWLLSDGMWSDWTNSSECLLFCGNSANEGTSPQNNGTCQTNGSRQLPQLSVSRLWGKLHFLVDGAWTEWNDITQCNVTCGEGMKEQVRYCANPAPQGSGANCTGPPQQSTPCNITMCPIPGENGFNFWMTLQMKCFILLVDGAWTSWSYSSPCSVTCGNGAKDQVRYCANPAPQAGGEDCTGPKQQIVSCLIGKCPANGRGRYT